MLSVAALEEAVLSLLCYSSDATKLAMSVTYDLFTSRVNQLIAKTALEHIEKYHSPAGGALELILETDLRRGDEGILLGKTLSVLKEKAGTIDAVFVKENLDKFVQIQRLSGNLQTAMEHLHVGELEKAHEAIFRSPSSTSGTSGIWLSDADGMLRAADRRSDEFISSGINVFDDAGISLSKGTLTFLIASTGKGKSWWLIEVGRAGLQHNHSVLHITAELSESKTAGRYIQTLFSLTQHEAKTLTIPYIERDADGKGISKIDFKTIRRDSIPGKKAYIKDKLLKANFPPLLIKEFPTSSLSTEQLLLYLDTLEREKRFKPDILIIDYADLMRIDASALRVDTGRLYRELRGIAMQRNCAVVTASQGNRESAGSKFVELTHAAEDWSKPGTADLVFTYSQTEEEFLRGLARVKAAKVRDGKTGMTALVAQCYEIGQFCLDSVFMAAAREELEKIAPRGE